MYSPNFRPPREFQPANLEALWRIWRDLNYYFINVKHSLSHWWITEIIRCIDNHWSALFNYRLIIILELRSSWTSFWKFNLRYTGVYWISWYHSSGQIIRGATSDYWSTYKVYRRKKLHWSLACSRLKLGSNFAALSVLNRERREILCNK